MKVQLYLNDPQILEEITTIMQQLQDIKNEIKNAVDIKEEPDDPSLVEFKFIPNNVVLIEIDKVSKNLKLEIKDEINKAYILNSESVFIKQNDIHHSQQESNDLYNYEINLNKQRYPNNNETPMTNIDLEEQYQVMNDIDHSIHDLLTIINDKEQKQLELDQS